MRHEIKAEMSGTLWKLLVNVGDSVTAGQEVAILESMKMEVPMETPSDGTVKEILVQPTEFVDGGGVVLIVESSD
jgi:acetyl-CoA carboxylase biotin carboxyl carrier protein